MNQAARALLGEIRYQVLNELGSGATAKVGRVLDKHLNRIVAQKVFHAELTEDERLLRTFLNEARLVGYLSHPGIVPIFDLSVSAETPLNYTMPIVDGNSLGELMHADPATGNGQALAIAEALNILIKLCETLNYAHDKGVLHLDLKPDNIVVGEFGEVLIMDWGTGRLKDPTKYAKHLHEATEHNVSVNFESEDDDLFLGTPKYMSPEQTTASRNELNYASDIFSMGIIAHQLFSGIHPFHAKDLPSLFSAIQSEEVPRLDQTDPTLPARLAEIVSRMLAKSTAARYASFSEVLEDLNTLRTAGAAFESRTYEQDEVIFSQGDPSEYAFTIVSGEVQVSINVEGDEKIMSTLGAGSIVGEIGVITGQARTATIKTLCATQISVLKKAQLESELEKLSPWVGQLIEGLADRFNSVNRELAEIKPSE